MIKEGKLLKVDIGCGDKPTLGFLSLDCLAYLEPDILCDVEEEPISLPNNSCNHIICNYMLEHVEKPLAVMNEIWRICVNGANVMVGVPHAGWDGAYKDPTHKHFFTEDSWKYWNSRDDSIPHYGYECKFDLVQLEIRLHPDFVGKNKNDPELQFAMKHYRNVIEKIDFHLRAVKGE